MHRISFLLGALCLLILAVGCGGGQDMTLVVGQLGNTSLTSAAGVRGMVGSNASAVVTHKPSDAIPSTSNFSYAIVDGIKIRLNNISFRKNGNIVSTSDLGGQVVELGSGVTNVNLNTSISVDPGDYDSISVDMDEWFQVKAFCQTDSHLVYTKNDNTIESTVCTGTCLNTMPADYGYKTYEYLNLTTAESPTSTSDRAVEETRSPISIVEGSSANVAILIDTSLTVACYDGDGAGPVNNQTGALDPFAWGPRNGDIADYYPSNQPNFGIGYLPLFSWAGTAGEALPTAETYLTAATNGDLNVVPVDYTKVMISTFAFNADESILGARGRNFGTGVDLSQMFMNFVDNGDGTYSMDNGEWHSGLKSDPSVGPGPFVDRHIPDWQRLELTDGTAESTLKDGPHCNNTDMQDEEGARVTKDCTNVESKIYWKRFRRDDE